MRKRYASTMQKIILTQAPMEADIEIAVEEKIQDFKAVHWNSELEKDETSYFFDKPIWEKLKKHPRWRSG